MNPHAPLHGLICATHTPFHTDGSLHLDPIESQAAHLLKNGVTTAFIGGSTGESASLTLTERLALAERWFLVTSGSPLRIVVHVGANCLHDARTLATQAGKLGAAAISALAPSYFKPRSTSVLIDSCAAIASAAPDTPFYYYDIPALTGINLSPEEFLNEAPARIPNLAGIKYTNADLMTYQYCLRSGFDVPYGLDTSSAPSPWAQKAPSAVASTSPPPSTSVSSTPSPVVTSNPLAPNNSAGSRSSVSSPPTATWPPPKPPCPSSASPSAPHGSPIPHSPRKPPPPSAPVSNPSASSTGSADHTPPPRMR